MTKHKSAEIVRKIAALVRGLEESKLAYGTAVTPAQKAWRTMRRRKLHGLIVQLKTAIGRDFFGKRAPAGHKCPACGQWLATYGALGRHYFRRHCDGRLACACGKKFGAYVSGNRSLPVTVRIGRHLATCDATQQVLGALQGAGVVNNKQEDE